MDNMFFKQEFNLNEDFVSVYTLSKTLFLSSKTIYRLIKKKKLKTIKINGCHLVDLSSLKNIVKEV